MSLKTKLANFLAKYSTLRWNKVRALRALCRKLYLLMADCATNSTAQRKLSRKYLEQTSDRIVDTYPWPYADLNFAAWLENDRISADPAQRVRDDALIADRLGFVVRHPTSYCAWKIYEQTGKWLKCPAGFHWHARYWQELLTAAANGFTQVVPSSEVCQGHCYVGIMPYVGEYGLVVWLEDCVPAFCRCEPGRMIGETLLVSTYLPVMHSYERLKDCYGFTQFQVGPDEKIIWIQIS